MLWGDELLFLLSALYQVSAYLNQSIVCMPVIVPDHGGITQLPSIKSKIIKEVLKKSYAGYQGIK